MSMRLGLLTALTSARTENMRSGHYETIPVCCYV